MSADTKVQKAVDFITRIRDSSPDALNDLIVAEAGEAFAKFCLDYSINLITKDPDYIIENASSLMLMGYLIRANEEQGRLLGSSTPPRGDLN